VRPTRFAALAVLAALVTGCTGIELAPLGAAALSTGVGNAVKAGTEYTLTGTAYRTFSVPLEDLSVLARRTLDRLDLPVTGAAVHDTRLTLVAEGIDRTVRLTLTPISPSVTRLGVTVKRGPIVRDRATTSELVTQIEQAVLPVAAARRAAATAHQAAPRSSTR
jgi:hypothetical protein